MNMDLINKAAEDYTRLILAEYPPAVDGGLGVSVVLDGNVTYMVTLTPNAMIPVDEPVINPLPAPEELLLHHPDSPVSDEPES